LSIKAIAKTTAIIIVAVVVIVAAVGTVLYYQMTAKPARDYFRIGVPVEITGPWSREGNMIKRGYEAWRNYINEVIGGLEIDGKKYRIEYVYADLKSDPSIAADAYEKLILTGDIDWIWGPMASSCVLAGGPVADKYGMLQLDGTCESHLIPQRKFKWTFTLQPVTIYNGLANADLLKLIGQKSLTIALIYSDAAYNTGLGEGFQMAVEKANKEGWNFQIVYKEVYSDGVTDLSAQITKAKLANPDVFVNFAYFPHGVIMTRNMKELGFNPKMIITNVLGGAPEYRTELGKDANYQCCSVSWVRQVNYPDIKSPLWGDNKKYVEYFENYFGVEGEYSSSGCAAVGEIMQVLLQRFKMKPPLSQADREKLQDALEKETFDTFWGHIKFSNDPTYWHSNEAKMINVQCIAGKIVVVGPADVEEKNLVYPRPKWEEL